MDSEFEVESATCSAKEFLVRVLLDQAPGWSIKEDDSDFGEIDYLTIDYVSLVKGMLRFHFDSNAPDDIQAYGISVDYANFTVKAGEVFISSEWGTSYSIRPSADADLAWLNVINEKMTASPFWEKLREFVPGSITTNVNDDKQVKEERFGHTRNFRVSGSGVELRFTVDIYWSDATCDTVSFDPKVWNISFGENVLVHEHGNFYRFESGKAE